MEGLNAPFTAPFMTAITPTPGPTKGISFTGSQHPPRFAFGEEGKISFQPEDSDWIFSAGIRYGRSHGRQHVHQAARTSRHIRFLLASLLRNSVHRSIPRPRFAGTQAVAAVNGSRAAYYPRFQRRQRTSALACSGIMARPRSARAFASRNLWPIRASIPGAAGDRLTSCRFILLRADSIYRLSFAPVSPVRHASEASAASARRSHGTHRRRIAGNEQDGETDAGLGNQCRRAVRPAKGERPITRPSKAIIISTTASVHYAYPVKGTLTTADRTCQQSQHPLALRHGAECRRLHAGCR